MKCLFNTTFLATSEVKAILIHCFTYRVYLDDHQIKYILQNLILFTKYER